MTVTVTAPEPGPTEEPTTEPVVTEEPTTEPVVTEEPTTEPVVTEEPTTEPLVTEEPTTEPAPTSIIPNLNVEAVSNMFATQTKDAKFGDTVEIAFNLDKAYTVDSFQWKMTYDDTKLKLNEVTTPGVDITVFNIEDGKVRAAASNAVDPFEYAEGDTFVLVKFEVIGVGDTTVDLNVQVWEEHEDEEPTTEPIVTEEPTTEPEPTEEPTTEPVVTEEPTTEPVVTEETTAAPEETTVAPEETTVAPEETTAATDAPSATGDTTPSGANGNGSSSSTSDSASGSSSSGAVQTGSASMAIIILLVLVSATAGIYFTRKRREDK